MTYIRLWRTRERRGTDSRSSKGEQAARLREFHIERDSKHAHSPRWTERANIPRGTRILCKYRTEPSCRRDASQCTVTDRVPCWRQSCDCSPVDELVSGFPADGMVQRALAHAPCFTAQAEVRGKVKVVGVTSTRMLSCVLKFGSPGEQPPRYQL